MTGHLAHLAGLLSPQRARRHESIHAILESITRKLGFRLYNGGLAWPEDAEYRAVRARFSGPVARVIHERRFSLYNLAKAVQNIPGDTAECGVFRAEGSFLICQALGCTREHHGFDSFEGLSAPDASVDLPVSERDRAWREGDLTASEAVAIERLSGCGKVRLYRGWIPQRFAEVADRRFAFVHLDVDLYQPTLDSLRFFAPRLNTGGMLVCDDYGFRTCPGARRAVDEYCAAVGLPVTHLTTGQSVVIRPPSHTDQMLEQRA